MFTSAVIIKLKRRKAMKISSKKRHFVMAGLVLVLGAAVLVNWYFTDPEKNPVAAENGSDINEANGNNLGDAVFVSSSDINEEYFANAKLSRDESYDSAVATLKEIIDSSEVDEQSVRTAADSINSITNRKVAQVNIENLVTAKTGSKCVAVISDDSAEIIVADSILNDATVLQIKEIVIENTDISSEKISIIGAK